MARYGRQHQVIMNETADLESDNLRRDMFDGAEDATRIRKFSTSGYIDPYTEEITYDVTHSWENVSGIIGTVTEDDLLLGDMGGRMKAGDVMVTYHYDTVSGVYLQQPLKEVELITPAVSGLYHVGGKHIGTYGGRPMFLKVGLKLDSNDK